MKKLKSKEVTDIGISNRVLENHVVEQFTTNDGDKDWYGQELEVKSDPLIDYKNEGAVILRFFYFKANAEIMKRDKPTKQMIFNNHAKQIELMLWSDGLEPMQEIPPRIITSKKRDEYKIFVTCKPRRGVALDQTPLTLQQITTKQNG